MLCALQNLKMCVHETHHLVLIFQYFLVTMWYVIFMRNSNSTMSIDFSSCFLFASCLKIKWFITLWGSNKQCAYYNPIKMWTFEVCHLELIVYIIHFLCGMFSQTSSNFLFVILWLLFAWACLVWFFSNMHFHILCEKPFVSFYSNHGFAGWFE